MYPITQKIQEDREGKYLMLSAKKAKRKGRAYEFEIISKESRDLWKFLLKKKNVVWLLRGS